MGNIGYMSTRQRFDGWELLHHVTKRLQHLIICVLGVVVVGLALDSSPTLAADTCEGPAIRVQVNDQSSGKKEPIAGVSASVTNEAGDEVVSGETDDKGIALLCVPEKATYTVTIDTSTLPDGKSLQGENTATVTESRFTTNVRTVNFFTGAAQRATTGYWDRLFQALLNGARLGIVIAICSVGLSLIFGTTGLTNFAHGELVTFGGVVAWWLSVSAGLPFIISAALAVLLGGALGVLLDVGLFAPLRRRGIGLISQMVVSVGLSIAGLNFFLMTFGGFTERYSAYNVQVARAFGPFRITDRDLTTMLISLAVLVAVGLLLQKSRLGKATRAVSDNPDLASTTGIDSQRIIRIVWFLGGALAALGGVVRGLDEGVKSDMGADLLFLMFAGITLGGLGSAYGALIGGFIVGLFVEVSTLGIPAMPEIPWLQWIKDGVPTELKTVPALAVLILILLFRPQGILGQRERVG
jgi:neutral amino acid transport system permease protein